MNGEAPRYSYGCGFNCAPGPGYWPIDAPEHPTAMGWRNPTHIIAKRAFGGAIPSDAEVVVARGAAAIATVWSAPSDHADAAQIGDVALNPGDRYRLLAIATGPEASDETSAEGYRLWYRIQTPEIGRVWVQSVVPSSNDKGPDGRPSSVRFVFFPVVSAR